MTTPLTVTQAAAIAGVTPSLVRRWIRDGRLPARRDPNGRRTGQGLMPWIVDEHDLLAVDRGTVGPPKRKEKP